MTELIQPSRALAGFALCLSCASCSGDLAREAPVSRAAQPLAQIGAYANFSGLEGKKVQEMSATYTVSSDASGPSATYFVATSFDLVNTSGTTVNLGYIGLQPYSPETGAHTAVFSIWGATAGVYADGMTRCKPDADGDPGQSCLIRKDYTANTPYTMKVQHVAGGVYKGFINGDLIATITLPGTVAIGNLVRQWIEPYTAAKDCESSPYFKAALNSPSLVPAVALTRLAPNFGPGYCQNVKVFQNATNHEFEIGTPAPATGISLKVKGSTQFVYAASTAEGCGGGGLKNDGSTFGNCARLTEVDRGAGNVLVQTENGRRIRCLSGTVVADERGLTPIWIKSLGADGFYSYRSGTRYLGSSGTSLNCTATALGDAQRFNRSVAPPTNTYRLRNAWQNQYLVDPGAGRAYYSSASHTLSPDSHWTLEDWGETQKRFKNRSTGGYLNNEGHPVDALGNRVVASTPIDDGANSAAWNLEQVAPATYRLQNFWSHQYITTEKQLGYVDLNDPAPGWLSAQWVFEPLVPYENLALAATATGSTQTSGQGFAQARDGVVSGYPLDPSKEWATLGQKAGAFIQYTWQTAQPLLSITLNDRINLDDQVLSGALSFSDGSALAVGALPNDGAPLVLRFAARSVTWVRFTVNSVSATTANVGLAELEAR
ncbi:MAG TPA: hypothetical protein VK524_10515 [Polyangiaceae bacterium]|nr:hypothetical protein [Polyangiaceae bacterium]